MGALDRKELSAQKSHQLRKEPSAKKSHQLRKEPLAQKRHQDTSASGRGTDDRIGEYRLWHMHC